ncbi:MAG: histidinol-phosphate transaminase [Chloroflexi bacterium]|nr:histidinol-phosphate transaminase [Chloroflexota bacterium]
MSNPRLNPDLLKIPIYKEGKSIEEVKKENNLVEVIKLASNESPTGSSPLAVEAARNFLDEAFRYPGVIERDLRQSLAEYTDPGLTERNFLIGNGGTDVIRMIIQAFVFDGGNTVMSQATFPMYHIFTTAFGGKPKRVPPTLGYKHDLDEMSKLIDEDTRIVFLCSPNNPSGNIITQSEADEFLSKVPDNVVVVIDEAYHDYITEESRVNSLQYIFEGRNILVVRTFSKSAGLANLRVGYMIGPEDLVEYVSRVKMPFHTGAIALAAANGSLKDKGFRKNNVEAVIDGREYIQEKICELGLNCLPSQANFVTIDSPPLGANGLTEALLQRGVIVRAMEGFGIPNAIRITVGSKKENDMLLTTLEEIVRIKEI